MKIITLFLVLFLGICHTSSRIYEACGSGNLRSLEEAIQTAEKTDNARYDANRAALILLTTAKEGDRDAVAMLERLLAPGRKYPVALERPDSTGHGLLWYAVHTGMPAMVKAVLAAGTQPDDDPLLEAIRLGNEEIVMLLLETAKVTPLHLFKAAETFEGQKVIQKMLTHFPVMMQLKEALLLPEKAKRMHLVAEKVKTMEASDEMIRAFWQVYQPPLQEVSNEKAREFLARASKDPKCTASLLNQLTGKDIPMLALAISLLRHLPADDVIPAWLHENAHLRPFIASLFKEQAKDLAYTQIFQKMDLETARFFASPRRFALCFGDAHAHGSLCPISEEEINSLKEEEKADLLIKDRIKWLPIEGGSRTYLGGRAWVELLRMAGQRRPEILEDLAPLTRQLQWTLALDYYIRSGLLAPSEYLQLVRLMIEMLPEGQELLLPYGFNRMDGPHAMLALVGKETTADTFSLSLYNTGEGMEHHPSKAISGKLQYRPVHSFSGIPQKLFLESAFVKLIIAVPFQGHFEFLPNGDFIYQDLLKEFEDFLNPETAAASKETFYSPQQSKSSAYAVYRAYVWEKLREDVIFFIDTFIQFSVVKDNLLQAQRSFWWKESLTAQIKSIARKIYRHVSGEAKMISFDGSNFQSIQTMILQMKPSAASAHLAELVNGLKESFEMLKSVNPPLLPLPSRSFDPWDGAIRMVELPTFKEAAARPFLDLPTPGADLPKCLTVECVYLAISKVTAVIVKLDRGTLSPDYCRLTIRRALMLLPQAHSSVWEEAGNVNRHYELLADIEFFIEVLAKLQPASHLLTEGEMRTDNRPSGMDAFLISKATAISLILFQKIAPEHPLFKFSCNTLTFFNHWYLQRSFSAQVQLQFALVLARCNNDPNRITFNPTEGLTSFTDELKKIPERVKLTAAVQEAFEKWTESLKKTRESKTADFNDFFLSDFLSDGGGGDDFDLRYLKALKRLLVLSYYSHTFKFLRNFVGRHMGSMVTEKLEWAENSNLAGVTCNQSKNNFFDLSTFPDKHRKVADQWERTLDRRKDQLTMIMDLWSCPYLTIDQVFGYLLEFRISLTKQTAELLNLLISLPRSTSSTLSTFLRLFDHLGGLVERMTDLLPANMELLDYEKPESDNYLVLIEYLKMYLILMDNFKAHYSTPPVDHFLEYLSNLENYVKAFSTDPRLQQLLQAFRMKAELLKDLAEYSSIFPMIREFERIRKIALSQKVRLDHEAEVIFQEVRVFLGNMMDSQSPEEQSRIICAVLNKRDASGGRIAYPMAILENGLQVNLEMNKDLELFVRAGFKDTINGGVLEQRNFSICLESIPNDIARSARKIDKMNVLEVSFPFGSLQTICPVNSSQCTSFLTTIPDGQKCSEVKEKSLIQKYVPIFPDWLVRKRHLEAKEEFCSSLLAFYCPQAEKDHVFKIVDLSQKDHPLAEINVNQRTINLSNTGSLSFLDASQVKESSLGGLFKFRSYHETWGADDFAGNLNFSYPSLYLTSGKEAFVRFHALQRPKRHSNDESLDALQLRTAFDGTKVKVDGFDALEVPLVQHNAVQLFQDCLIVKNITNFQAIVPDVSFEYLSKESLKYRRFRTVFMDAEHQQDGAFIIKPRSRYEQMLMAYHYSRSGAYSESMRLLRSINHLSAFSAEEYRVLTFITLTSSTSDFLNPETAAIEYAASLLILYNQRFFPTAWSDVAERKVALDRLKLEDYELFWCGKVVIERGWDVIEARKVLQVLLSRYLQNDSKLDLSMNLQTKYFGIDFWSLAQENILLNTAIKGLPAAVRLSHLEIFKELDAPSETFQNYSLLKIKNESFTCTRARDPSSYRCLFNVSTPKEPKSVQCKSCKSCSELEPMMLFASFKYIEECLELCKQSAATDQALVEKFFILLRRRLSLQMKPEEDIIRSFKQIFNNELKETLTETFQFEMKSKSPIAWLDRKEWPTETQRIQLERNSAIIDVKAFKPIDDLQTVAEHKLSGDLINHNEILTSLMSIGYNITSVTGQVESLLRCTAREDLKCYVAMLLTENTDSLLKIHNEIVAWLKAVILSRQLVRQKNGDRNALVDVRFIQDPMKDVPIECWNHPSFLVLEYINNFTIRRRNVASVCRFLRKSNDQFDKFLLQLMMGSGKTFVIGPLLALNFADGETLSVMMPPSPLFPTNSSDLLSNNLRVFAQKGHVITFNRDSHYIEVSNLRLLHTILADAIKDRQFVIVKPETLQIMENKFIELKYSGSSSMAESLDYLRKIINIFRDYGAVVIDEVDSTFGRLRDLNFPLDESDQLDPVVQYLMGIIMNYVILVPEIARKIRLLQNQQAAFFNDSVSEYLQTMIPTIAKHFINDLMSPESDYFGIWGQVREAIGINAIEDKQIRDQILLFLTEHDVGKRGLPEFTAKNGSKSQILWLTLWWQLHHWLEQAFRQTYQVNFGRSFKDLAFLVARPYLAAMTPDELSTFSNEYETWNKTAMMYKMGAFLPNQLQEYLQLNYRWIRDRCYEERVEVSTDGEYKGISAIFGENWHHRANLSGHLQKLVRMLEETGPSSNVTSLNDPHNLALLFIDSFIVLRAFPTATFFKRQITTCPLFISTYFKSISGYSGTMTEDKYMFPQALRTRGNFQLDPEVERVRERIQNISIQGNPDEKHNNHAFFMKDLDFDGKEKAEEFVCRALQSSVAFVDKSICNVHAIIDIGAIFKMYPTKDVTAAMLKCVSKNCPNIKGSFFFQRDAVGLDKLHFLNLQGNATPLDLTDYDSLCTISQTNEQGWLTYYDQFHTTGTDIRQAPDAVALVTLGADTQERDFLQGVMRLRGFLYASMQGEKLQSAIFAIPESLRRDFFRTLGHSDAGKDIRIDLTSLIKYTEAVSKRENAKDNVKYAMIKLRKIARDEAMSLMLRNEEIDFRKIQSLFIKEQPERLDLLSRYPKHINLAEALENLMKDLLGTLSSIISDKKRLADVEELMKEEISTALSLQNIESSVFVMSTHENLEVSVNVTMTGQRSKTTMAESNQLNQNMQQQQQQQKQQQQQQQQDQEEDEFLKTKGLLYEQLPWVFYNFKLLSAKWESKYMSKMATFPMLIPFGPAAKEAGLIPLADHIVDGIYLSANTLRNIDYDEASMAMIPNLLKQQFKDQRRAVYFLWIHNTDDASESLVMLTNFDVKCISVLTKSGSISFEDDLLRAFGHKVYLFSAMGNVVCSGDLEPKDEGVSELLRDKIATNREVLAQAFILAGFTNIVQETLPLLEAVKDWPLEKKEAFRDYYLAYKVPPFSREAIRKSRFFRLLSTNMKIPSEVSEHEKVQRDNQVDSLKAHVEGLTESLEAISKNVLKDYPSSHTEDVSDAKKAHNDDSLVDLHRDREIDN